MPRAGAAATIFGLLLLFAATFSVAMWLGQPREAAAGNPVPTSTPTITPTPTSTPTPFGTHALGGVVCRGPYDPNFCEYLYAFPVVTLQPGGRQVTTGYHGNFQFDGVPDGQYSLSLSPSCIANSIGGQSCYLLQAAVVNGSDTFFTWKPFAEATPTPTNTPCAGACPPTATPDCNSSPPGAGCPTFTPTATPTPACNTSPPQAGCIDTDGDFWPDNGDNCPAVANNLQANTDAANTNANRPGADGLGDACDPDIDGDGYTNTQEASLVGPENPNVYCAIMRADVDGDHAVSILDITVAAGQFGQSVPPAPDRYRQDADTQISILDLTVMVQVFLQNVSACP